MTSAYANMLCVARAFVDVLTAEGESLTTGAEQRQTERNTLANRICKLQVAVGTCNGLLGDVV